MTGTELTSLFARNASCKRAKIVTIPMRDRIAIGNCRITQIIVRTIHVPLRELRIGQRYLFPQLDGKKFDIGSRLLPKGKRTLCEFPFFRPIGGIADLGLYAHGQRPVAFDSDEDIHGRFLDPKDICL